MRVFISSDMEGTAGVVAWEQCRAPDPEYQYYRGLLQEEVNAAIEGAAAAGATGYWSTTRTPRWPTCGRTAWRTAPGTCRGGTSRCT